MLVSGWELCIGLATNHGRGNHTNQQRGWGRGSLLLVVPCCKILNKLRLCGLCGFCDSNWCFYCTTCFFGCIYTTAFFKVNFFYEMFNSELCFSLQEMNPFCLSANDKDMVLLISNPGPPNLDVSRYLCIVYREIFHDVARSVFFRLTDFCR